MANWKKIITSGSNAHLTNISASGDISASGNIIGDLSGKAGAVTGITSLLATDIKIGEDNETKIDFETANEIHFYANNTEQVYLADNIFGPQSDSDVDLGTTGVRWKDAYIDTVTTTGNITSAGTGSFNRILVDGEISASGTGSFAGLNIDGGLFTSASLASLGQSGGGTTTAALTAGGGLNNGGGTFNGGTARTFSVDSASMGAFFSASMNSFTTTGTGSFNRILVDGDISASGGLYGQVSTAAQTNITSILATDLKIGEDDQTKIDFETADEIHFYAANVEQVYLADNIFGPQSDSDVDLGSTGVRWKDAYIDTITTTGGVTIGGDLTVNGTTTTIATQNLDVEDQFLFLATGSAGSNLDAGIIVQSGSAVDSGSALYHDKTDQRWSVAKGVAKSEAAADQGALQFVTTVRTAANNPNATTSGSYGAGEMHVNTTSGEIWIRIAD